MRAHKPLGNCCYIVTATPGILQETEQKPLRHEVLGTAFGTKPDFQPFNTLKMCQFLLCSLGNMRKF